MCKIKPIDLKLNLDALTKEVIFDLIPGNKETFKKSERIKIIADLKNVPEVYINIYEFNSTNYY
jgi:hypothetical protein